MAGQGRRAAWGLRVAGLALLACILAQGTLYWHLKLRQVAHEIPLPSWFRALFSAFKRSNLAGIGALLAGAALEHVNYHHYQLMYDTRAAFAYLRRNGRLRKAGRPPRRGFNAPGAVRDAASPAPHRSGA